jgi:type I restriction enzyme, S subunit
MKYQPYKKYSKSGVDWIANIPSHWKIIQLRRCIIKVSNGTTEEQIDESDDSFPVTRIETISQGKINWSKVGWIIPNERIGRYILNVDDILLSHINSLSIIGNSAIFNGERILYHGMNLLRIEPNDKIVSKWLLYNLKSKGLRNKISALAKPAINQASISTQTIKSLELPLPPYPEQRSIAAFLDRETARIDALIDKKQQLIALLKEKRTALITRAVTKGLDTNAKMKDSGIEWLGEIPEHWEVKRLKHLVDAKPIKTEDSDKQYVGLENIESWTSELINLSDFQPDGVSNTFEKGNILFGKLRPYLAKATICDFSGICSTEIIVLSPIGIVGEYLLNIILSVGFIEKVNASTYGSKMPRASWEFIGNLQIPVPNLSEQHRIVEFLKNKIDKLTELTRKNKLAIEKLREYRTALISAAVTGKVRVGSENI